MISRSSWLGPLVALVVLFALFSVINGSTFASLLTVTTMLRQTAVVGIAAVGMTMIIVLGGIDLSVGSMVALTTVIVALLLRAGHGPVVAALGGVLAGALSGAVNGALIGGLRLSPFIATLGTMSVLRGAAKGWAGEQKVDVDTRGLDALLGPLPEGRGYLLVPPGVLMTLLLGAAVAFLLRRSRFGRHVFAVGSSEATARLCGLQVPWLKFAVYTFSGLLVGWAGVLQFSRLTVGDPTEAVGLELDVIAAVVIGGGSLSGGEGSVLGSLLGALLMTTIKTGCTYAGVPNWVQEIITGIIIVVAVGLDRLRHGRSSGGPQ